MEILDELKNLPKAEELLNKKSIIEASLLAYQKLGGLTSIDFLKMICLEMTEEYERLTKIIDGVIVPFQSMRVKIKEILSLFTDEIFDTIENQLNNVYLPIRKFNSFIQPGDYNLETFFGNCPFFKDIMNSLSLNLDIKSTGELNKILGIPKKILDIFKKETNKIIDKLLDEVLDKYKYFLEPLYQYENMLENSGIIDLLYQIEKFERCMTNKNLCNMNEEKFKILNLETNSYQWKSEYYRYMLGLDSLSNIRFNIFFTDYNKELKFKEIYKKYKQYKDYSKEFEKIYTI